QEVWDTLVQVGKTRDDYKLQYEKQMAKKPPVTTYYFGYILAAMDYNAVLHRVGIALENYNSFRIKANDLIAIVDKGTPQEMLQRIEELEEAYEQARNDLSEARENYADARTILDNAFAIVLGNLTLAQTAYAAVNSDMSAVTTARQRANVSVTFAQNILQDVSTLASQYQQAEDEVLQAEQAAIIAEEEAKGARLALALSVFAFLKAEAEVKEANRQADDDDDAAAGAAAAVTVANYASDSDLDPIFLIHALDAFGSPYLFSDEKDISYFHNSTIKPQGLINFQIDLFECATDSHSCWNQPADTNIAECAAVSGERWCEQLSPMPVVLIEVAIKNAKVLGFKVPGVSYISADRLQSPWSPYDTDEKARYVPLTEENEYIAEGDHQIIEAAYSTEVNTTGFPKYDHIKVPDLTGTGPQEFKMSNWARLPLVGTHKRLESLKQELIAKANATGVSPEEYFSFSHISHDFIKVHKTALGANSVPEVSDELTYELRNLMINRQYADRFSTMVTAEGPFEASYGLRPPGTQLQPNDEILTRAAQQEEISKSNERSADVGEPIRVYPNPTRGLVNIQFSVTNRSLVTVRLHSALGNLLHETEAYFDAGSHLKAIDVKKNCPPGTYIVTVTGAGKTQTAKVVAE
ncbi:MAG: T9SS type A sorting domain-containing protein, partial [Bacteroidota bacterium]